MKPKKIAAVGILTAAAIVIHIIESAIPPIVPVPGIKPGFANIVTLAATVLLGRREGFAVTMLRITLGAVFAGSFSSFLYSAAGGLLSFAVMAALIKPFGDKLWFVSTAAGVAHNVGQILVAAAILKSVYTLYYLPVLIISGLAAGVFVGLISTFLIRRLEKILPKLK